MPAPNVASLRVQVESAFALANLLERIEHSSAAMNADQYQAVVSRLKAALSEPLPEAALDAVLGLHPSAAQVYENMHYEVSGLSRTSLERSVSSELLAAQVLARFSLAGKPTAAE